MKNLHGGSSFNKILHKFLYSDLTDQSGLRPKTLVAYRDTLRIFLEFMESHYSKDASDLTPADVSASVVIEFLKYLETVRGNVPKTINIRLAAMRSFMAFAAAHDPKARLVLKDLQTIPVKRLKKPEMSCLSHEEVMAIIQAPNPSTWSGARDRAMLATVYNCGARVSEIVLLRRSDVYLNCSGSIRLHGGGLKERRIPLWSMTRHHILEWLGTERIGPDALLFPNRKGQILTRSGVEDRLRKAVAGATTRMPSLARRSVSPEMIRRTTAVHLLKTGVSPNAMAIWLGLSTSASVRKYTEAAAAVHGDSSVDPPEIQGKFSSHFRYQDLPAF